MGRYLIFSSLPNYMRVIIAFLAIAFVVVAGKFAVNPLFRAIAAAGCAKFLWPRF